MENKYEGFEISEFEYRLFEMGYIDEMKEPNEAYKNMDDNMIRDILFPIEWTLNRNYRLKALILTEAYKKGVKVNQVPMYSEIISDIVITKENHNN